MGFGDVIRSGSSPSGNPFGIGGDANTIWHCDYSAYVLYELNTSNFSVIRSIGSTYSNPSGMGGDANTIWLCYLAWTYRLYEVDTSDLSFIRYASSPGGDPHGIGGDANTIWHSDDSAARLYELNTSDFSVIRNLYPSTGHPYGTGGDANTIWLCDYLVNRIQEHSTSDLSVIRSAGSPAGGGSGIGGDANTIWHCDYVANKIYKLDATSTYTISGNVKDSDGNNLNNVTITLEDGTDYSTSTNASGNYSQAVNPDVYTVIASLAGYISSSASVDASSSNQTQNFTLSKPVLSGTISDEFGNPIRDADITISNGTTYTTTTDENGAYSQVVDADTYDIAVSKSRSTFHDITESSVAVAADTTQDITMLTDKVLGIQNAIKGISIPGGISMGRSRR